MQSLSWHLFKSMIKEEWRLHASLLGGLGSGLFPFMIFLFTSLGAFITPYIMGNIQLSTILLMLHTASVIYGVFVGGFGKIGEHVMTRRLGQVSMLLQLPQQYPVSFKHVMGVFYLKDSLFYLIYSYVPLVLGVSLTAPSAGVSPLSVLVLGVTMYLAFMLGMGLSFALSALSLKSRKTGFILTCIVLSLFLLCYPLNFIPIGYVIPSLGYWITKKLSYIVFSIAEAVLMASVGVYFMKERFELHEQRHDASLLGAEARLGYMGGLRTFVAKEWLELVRSNSLFPALTGFGGHLLAIYFISWLFQVGFEVSIDFNVVFYSGIVGFMGVMTYSFLTNIEHNEYLNVQPVSVDMVVKSKLMVYLLLTSGVAVGYVLLIGFLKGQLGMVPIGVMVALSTSLFVVAVTAYLTGLWTNTMFFGAKTILKFTVIVAPPLTVIEIASMILQFKPQLAVQIIYGFSLVLLFVAVLIYNRLENRWSDKSFSYVSTGI